MFRFAVCPEESPDSDPSRRREESLAVVFCLGLHFTSDGLPHSLGLAEAGFVVDGKKARPLTFFVPREAPDFLRVTQPSCCYEIQQSPLQGKEETSP